MTDKRVHLTYYYWGMACLWMTIFAILTGKAFWFDQYTIGSSEDHWFVEFIYHDTEPVMYCLITACYALASFVSFYKSLLFIGTNREDLIESDGFDRRVVGLESTAQGVNMVRVLTIAFFSMVIVWCAYWIHFFF